jgi:hypothetical protein
MFMVKPEKIIFSNDDISTTMSDQPQQRIRYMTSVGGTQRNTTPTKNGKKETSKFFPTNHSSSPGMEKKNSLPSAHTIASMNTAASNQTLGLTNPAVNSNSSSYDMFKKVRDECTYRYFICAELLIGASTIK